VHKKLQTKLKPLITTFHSSSRRFSTFFARNKLKFILALTLLFALPTVAAAGWIAKDQVLKPKTTILAELNLDKSIPKHFIGENIDVSVKVWQKQEKATLQPAKVSLFIDDQSIKSQEVALTHQPQTLQFSLNVSSLNEGSHQARISVVDIKSTKELWQESWEFTKDTQAPNLLNVTLSDATASGKVTYASESSAISVGVTKPVAVKLKLQFSEPVNLSIDQNPKVTLQLPEIRTDQPEIQIPAGLAPFKVTYRYTDQNSQQRVGELSYSYDNKPPTFTVTSPLNPTDKWGLGYGLTFYPSEPVTDLRVTYNGQPLSPYTHDIYKNVAKTTLSLGSNNIFVISGKDANGNVGTKTVTVTVTKDDNPVQFPGSKPAFRPCTPELRDQCRAKVGYDFGSDCDKYKQYVLCLKPICDSTTGHNICENP
jgi:hypothetical protein